MGKCPKHPDTDLYTPTVRRAGRPDFSLPVGWCFVCYEENDRRAEHALYFARSFRDLLSAAPVEEPPIARVQNLRR